MIANLLSGFGSIFSIECILWILFGVLLGISFGCIPGLSSNIALTLCLTLIYTLDTIPAVCLITGIYIGGCSGGLISAILINIPGAPANITTAYDGFPMAQRGEAGKALGTAIFYSFFGCIFSFIILFAVAEPMGRIALKFGNMQLFALTFFALTLVSGIAGKDVIKGVASALIGITLSLIGISAVDGTPRFTMGFSKLNAGLELVPALIGLYAISELMKSGTQKKGKQITMDYKIHGFGFTWKEFKQQFGNFLRSSAIGTAVGIMPGVGGTTANVLSYSVAKNTSKHPEKYGTGYIGGVVASESSNNAAIGGALIPMITLGIPGDGFTAIFMGALILQGLQPGPLFMVKSSGVVYSLFAALLIANFATLFFEYFFIRGFVRLLKIPRHILLSIVVVLAIVGAYGINNRLFDAWTVLFFGALGFFMSYLELPFTPLILGLILGCDCEEYLRIAMQITKGSFLPFIQDPVTCVMLVLSLISLILAPKLISRANRGS